METNYIGKTIQSSAMKDKGRNGMRDERQISVLSKGSRKWRGVGGKTRREHYCAWGEPLEGEARYMDTGASGCGGHVRGTSEFLQLLYMSQ